MRNLRYDVEENEVARDEDLEVVESPIARLNKFFGQLRGYYPLYFAVLVICIFGFILRYALAQPEYEAVAIIGPPNPSPTSAMISSIGLGGKSLAGGLRSLAGGGAGSNDPYNQYLQLLYSGLLSQTLADQDKILPIVFYKLWDAKEKRWSPHGVLFEVKAAIKRFFDMPVRKNPDAEMLAEYLKKNFTVSQSITGLGLSSLVGPTYMTVSIKYKSPAEATKLLNVILDRADEIIRQQQLKDILSRIDYIESELPKVTQAEQRSALIDILSNQEDLKVMMIADQHFAITIIDTPHASLRPVSPMSPQWGFVVMLLLSGVFWIALVALVPRFGWIQRVSDRLRFRRK